MAADLSHDSFCSLSWGMGADLTSTQRSEVMEFSRGLMGEASRLALAEASPSLVGLWGS